MKRSAPEPTQGSVIDLPLDASLGTEVNQTGLPLEEPHESSDSSVEPVPDPPASEPASPASGGGRTAAGLVDLAAHLAVLASAIAGSWALGVPLQGLSLLPFVLLVACFSFVYHVLPLTFWGQTPGMASGGFVARSQDGGPLTINQSVRRWLGAVLNTLALGLPWLFLREPSLADRLSGSTVTKQGR